MFGDIKKIFFIYFLKTEKVKITFSYYGKLELLVYNSFKKCTKHVLTISILENFCNKYNQTHFKR